MSITASGCGRLLLPPPTPGEYSRSTANWDAFVVLHERLPDERVLASFLTAEYMDEDRAKSPDGGEVYCGGWMIADHVLDPRSGELCFLGVTGAGFPRRSLRFAQEFRVADAKSPNDWYMATLRDVAPAFIGVEEAGTPTIFAIVKDEDGRVVEMMRLHGTSPW